VVKEKRMSATIAPHDIHRLLHAEHDDPFGVLGLQQIDQIWVVRSFRPDAKELAIVDRHQVNRRFPATRIADEGLFEAQLEGVSEAFDYLLELTTWSGASFQISDPYSYGPILGELDMHLYKVGNHYEIYEKLGAHLTAINGHAGVSFAVWAPSAQRVSVVGDFNDWDGRTHAMRKRIEAGIWEIFVPGVAESAHYKYEVRNCFGNGGRENLDAIEFMKHFNAVCYERFPGIMTIAEESTAWPGVSRPTYLGGLGFGFKWNMGWMHDFLTYTSHEPIHRRYHFVKIDQLFRKC
jgi:1,4-alpha-glucan branching enzyme